MLPEFAASPSCNAHALRNVSHEASTYKTYTSKAKSQRASIFPLLVPGFASTFYRSLVVTPPVVLFHSSRTQLLNYGLNN